jgi:hypothetical protein
VIQRSNKEASAYNLYWALIGPFYLFNPRMVAQINVPPHHYQGAGLFWLFAFKYTCINGIIMSTCVSLNSSKLRGSKAERDWFIKDNKKMTGE